MTTIQDKYTTIKTEVEKITGNVKGGFKQPLDAVEEIHTLYGNLIDSMRYPGESSVITSNTIPYPNSNNNEKG